MDVRIKVPQDFLLVATSQRAKIIEDAIENAKKQAKPFIIKDCFEYDSERNELIFKKSKKVQGYSQDGKHYTFGYNTKATDYRGPWPGQTWQVRSHLSLKDAAKEAVMGVVKPPDGNGCFSASPGLPKRWWEALYPLYPQLWDTIIVEIWKQDCIDGFKYKDKMYSVYGNVGCKLTKSKVHRAVKLCKNGTVKEQTVTESELISMPRKVFTVEGIGDSTVSGDYEHGWGTSRTYTRACYAIIKNDKSE